MNDNDYLDLFLSYPEWVINKLRSAKGRCSLLKENGLDPFFTIHTESPSEDRWVAIEYYDLFNNLITEKL